MGHPNSGRDKLAFLFSFFFFLEEMELKLLFWTLVWLQFFCCSDLLLARTASTPRSSTASDPSVSLNNVLVCYKSTFKKKLFSCIWNDFHHTHTVCSIFLCYLFYWEYILRMYWVLWVQSAVFDQKETILPFSDSYQYCLISLLVHTHWHKKTNMSPHSCSIANIVSMDL